MKDLNRQELNKIQSKEFFTPGGVITKKNAIEKAIEKAAGELPKGWKIELNIYFEGWWIVLFDDEGTKKEFCQDGTIFEVIESALKKAKQIHAANQ